MSVYKSIRWAAMIGLVTVTATGCSLLKSSNTSQSIDPPPVDVGAAVNDSNKAISVSTVDKTISASTADKTIKQAAKTAVGTTQVTLYFKDNKGYVAPISMNIPSTEQIAQKSLEYMVEDGIGKSLLPKGFTALLPKGTQIKSMNIIKDQKLAVVDFSNAFSSYNPEDERKIMEAVVWTLTGFPSVDKVQLRLEGKTMKEMPVYNTPLTETLSRTMGINLEIAPGINVGQSTPVTLYFTNKTEGQFEYFVPVTRMIKRTDKPMDAMLEQLIQGPVQNKGLSAVIAANAKVLTIKQSDDKNLITVNFNSQLVSADKKVSSEAIQSIILSLTENSGASSVQIMVNGEKKVSSSDNQNYSQPILRPAHVNQLKL